MTARVQVPGPRGSVLTGNLPEFARNPLDFLARTARDYGPVSSLRFGRSRAVLISDPAMIEELLVKRRLDFIKAGPIRAQRRLFGNGLLINEGESWTRQRRLAQPAFHPGNLAPYVPIVVSRTRAMLEKLASRESCDVPTEMQQLLMGIVAEALFGSDAAPRAAEIGAAVDAAMTRYSARRGTARFLPDWFPVEDSRRYVNGVRNLDSFIEETIARRQSDSSSGRNDLLAMLLAARDEHGRQMSPAQLRDEAVNLFVGGFDTPSLALSWTWYLLATHPEIAERVHDEANSVFGGREPGVADYQRLHFTQKVLKEAMRLYPPAWILGREAIVDTRIGTTPIRKGTLVLISQWVMHRDGRYFEAPAEFDPDRWDTDRALPRFVYFPFGAGPRVCIGAAFATLECSLALAMIAQRFRFLMLSRAAVEPRATMTLRPATSMIARLVPR